MRQGQIAAQGHNAEFLRADEDTREYAAYGFSTIKKTLEPTSINKLKSTIFFDED